MSRKGGLTSSNDLESMTQIRWLFEYHSLVKKETEYWETARRLIISLFGLNLFGRAGLSTLEEDELGRFKDAGINEADLFLPLTMFINPMMNEKLISGYFEDQEVDKAMADMDFELLDPDSFETDLEVLLDGREFKVEEEARTPTTSDSKPKEKTIIIED